MLQKDLNSTIYDEDCNNNNNSKGGEGKVKSIINQLHKKN